MLIAITREVSPNLAQCELTYIRRQEIDDDLARTQHDHYERALTELGCKIERLAADPDLPDSVFVEDTAIVLDEIAILARPGIEARRGETSAVSEVLSNYRAIGPIASPGILEGGDVLHMGKTLYVGISERSNESGVRQLIDLVSPYGYEVVQIRVDGCLHLKSAVTQVDEETLLINRSWIDATAFEGKALLDVDPGEPYAANALLVGSELVYPASYPATCRRLEERDLAVRVVDLSELQKAEGGATCCSLIFPDESGTKGDLGA